MSRIGKAPIEIPSGVDVSIKDNNTVVVKGKNGVLTKSFHEDMIIKVEDGNIVVERPSELKKHKSLHGLTRTLINNMVLGVTEGFEKSLEINGVGYRAQKQGKKLILTLGYSHPVEMEEPEGVTVDVPAPNKITVKGIDKQAVGEFAAKIRSKRLPEVYKGKGIKYVDEVIRRKEGKTGK
ncbi:MAG: 50S ribosomal protein L6 [Clostridium sp.]|nr:50S ribosomal protein L6 [Clostridium sp.]